MGDISRHFDRDEFACKCGCGFDTVDVRLAEILQHLRDHFNKPIMITSAARCANHNFQIGGSPKSQHLLGRAADIQVQGVKPTSVYDYLNSVYKWSGGLGLYETFVHIDTRNSKARWGSE